MLDSDIVAVAERRLVQSDRNDEYSIPGFWIYRFDDEHNQDARIRTCRGIVLYSKIDFQHLQRISLGVATEAVLACFSFSGKKHPPVFFYVSPQKANQTCLCNILCHLLDILEANNTIIVMGDTNVDFFNQTVCKLLEQIELRQLIVSVYRLWQLLRSCIYKYFIIWYSI